MVQVAPSILAADFAHLGRDCARVLGAAHPLLHFDVMDGSFVPNLTVGIPVLQSLKKEFPEALFDVHLMVIRPLNLVEAFARAGADVLTFHIEAEDPVLETAAAIRSLGCEVGISLRPHTPVELLYPFLGEVDRVLVMSVEPGFGGQAFLPDAPGRIAALRTHTQNRVPPLVIEVDGGINEHTAPLCIEAGANILVAGTAVFGAPDPAEAMRRLAGG